MKHARVATTLCRSLHDGLVVIRPVVLNAHSGGAGATSDGVSSSSGGKEYAELLFVLREALSRDGSGMLFNETAGALRPDGVFSNEFFDHVSDLAAAAGAEEER